MILLILKKYDSSTYYIPNKVFNVGTNLDGLPLSRSSKSQLGQFQLNLQIVIFCQKLEYVLPIGIFHGNSKPKSIHKFFNPFLSDLLTLLNYGLNINGNFFFGQNVCKLYRYTSCLFSCTFSASTTAEAAQGNAPVEDR